MVLDYNLLKSREIVPGVPVFFFFFFTMEGTLAFTIYFFILLSLRPEESRGKRQEDRMRGEAMEILREREKKKL